METMLDEISEDFPPALFVNLNGGILLLPEPKLHEKNKNNDLFIMGEYHSNQTFGRYIAIYYGSFARVYGHLAKEELRDKLVSTMKHEFLHHIESLAGERGLEIKDANDLSDYLHSEG